MKLFSYLVKLRVDIEDFVVNQKFKLCLLPLYRNLDNCLHLIFNENESHQPYLGNKKQKAIAVSQLDANFGFEQFFCMSGRVLK